MNRALLLALRLASTGTFLLLAHAAIPSAHAQMSFSIDRDSPTRAVPECLTGAIPISNGDILAPCGGIPMLPLVPGLLPPPAILISGGTAPIPIGPGLGIPSYPQCVGAPPGVQCPIELDALSYGLEPPFPDVIQGGDPSLYFSVDEWAIGINIPTLTPSVYTESGGGALLPGDHAADVFVDIGALPPFPIPPGPVLPNHAFIDGDGRRGLQTLFAYPGTGLIEPTLTQSPGGPTPGDDLDALDLDGLPFSQQQFPVFFSLDAAWPDPRTTVPNSGTAAVNGVAGGDVLITVIPGGPFAIFAGAPALGLDIAGGFRSDDLDALILAENGDNQFQPSQSPFDWLSGQTDMLLFSVRAGSAVIGAPDSMYGAPIEPGDILTTPLVNSMISPFPAIFIPAETLGLATARSGMVNPPFWDDLNAADFRLEPILLAEEYCFGDGGLIMGCTPCPCGNNMPFGTQAGCMNSFGTGARLFAGGIASVTNDTLRFDIQGASPTSFALLFSGNNRLPIPGMPCPPGSGITQPIQDGLRCMGGSQLRHGIRAINAAGVTAAPWGPPGGPFGGLIAQGGFAAGQTRQWQAFYRDIPTMSCTTGLLTTSAVQVTMTP